jgi:potassium/hydrogen antiporter
MDKITVVVLFLGILIFSSHLFNRLFDKTKIPNVLILMIIGIVGGLFIDKQLFFGEMGRVFTTITLVIILFESGVGLKLSELKTAIASASLVTFINFVLTIIIVTTVLVFLYDFDFVSALFLGAILGGTSSAVVIPMIRQLKLGAKSSTVLLLESAFSDVLCLVVGLAALEGMKAGDIDVGGILNTMWQSFLFAALLGVAAGIIWSIILNGIRLLKNSMFTTFAFLFIIYAGVEMLGFNGGIAALAFGIILGNSEDLGKTNMWKTLFRFNAASLTSNEKDFFSEIVFVLQTYFFVYVGVVIEFGSFKTYLIALLLVIAILSIRPLVIKLFAKKGASPREVTIMSVMSPKGLIPAILASIPFQLGLANGKTIAETGYAVVLLSIIICSALIMIVSKDPFVFNKLIRKKKSGKSSESDFDGSRDLSETEMENPGTEDEVVIKTRKRYIDEFDDEE